MPDSICHAKPAYLKQYEEPVWEPLLEAVGEHLAGGFMWMHEAEFDDGSSLHAYKHKWTRRYLYLTSDGQAFSPTECGAYSPLRLDFAIEAALCSWWIFKGWEEVDRTAVFEAVVRAQERARESA